MICRNTLQYWVFLVAKFRIVLVHFKVPLKHKHTQKKIKSVLCLECAELLHCEDWCFCFAVSRPSKVSRSWKNQPTEQPIRTEPRRVWKDCLTSRSHWKTPTGGTAVDTKLSIMFSFKVLRLPQLCFLVPSFFFWSNRWGCAGGGCRAVKQDS